MLERDRKREKVSRLAAAFLQLARDSILVQMRFLDVAIAKLLPVEEAQSNRVATDGTSLFYDPAYILRACKEEPDYSVRLYLHVLLHCIFFHRFQYDKVDTQLWDMAADMAVEGTILEMGMPGAGLQTDVDARACLEKIKEQAGALTAEKIYRYLRNTPPSREVLAIWTQLFRRDTHALWLPAEKEELLVTQEQWKKIGERVKADLKSFSKAKTHSESMEKNLAEATRDRFDYAKLLQHFTVMGEHAGINEDEFDYVYYTYGLSHYGNMPLIEPLESKEAKRVRDFVIALDTSASCRGSVLRGFLRRTYSILKVTEHFFRKINVHIIQCDSEIRSDVKITCEADLDAFIEKETLQGFGSTDFRPVFAYVEQLLQKGEFENLKGLIYFTDGYGVYPEKMPGYDVIFAFLEAEDDGPPVPPWAMRVTFDRDDLEEREEKAR